MSDAPKPVEETPAAVPAAAPATEAPAATETTATETVAAETPKDTPAEATEAAPAATEESKADAPAEESKEEAKKEEVTPASEGILGYKAPGLVKGLRFAKRFFYFSDDAVEAKQLAVFHQNEKPATANPIAAWASQTGKGLLFFTKRAEDKPTPAGIFNLAEVSDIAKEGSSELHFKLNGQKHTFQAASASERDSWFAALEAKAVEAKAEKETVTSSEGYKAELEKLSKPAAAAAEPAKKAAEPKEEAAPAPVEDKKEDKAASKSRSQSRKRASIFGTLLGKKEETEEKKEEKKEEKTEEAKPAEATPEAPTEAPVEAPATTEAAEAAPAPAETADKKEDKEEKKEEKEEKKAEAPTAQKSKRASLFGNFFQKVTSPSHEKSEKEATAPAETPVASTAPQLDNPVEEAAVKPIEPESVTAPAEAEAAKEPTPAQSPAAETPKDKRRTSFFGNFGKKKGDSDNEGADGEPKPKGNKLGGLFRKPSKAVKSEPKETTEAEAAPKEETVQESPAEESAQPAEASAEEAKPVNVASTSTPVQAAA
ncbi:hypothetical protein BO71DRAFT_394721 [Aspergillus ellipticus CBS 707.79]|uniref:PH domain-containing protein n=1 Tax=Aspergillus ellipticus CBS 707.79 TaxID=1448320 RepID=A0A319DNB8_9EURO|nr:hypothetical protein BO71DRAFT_394721 [Aspergillus ellipticus CBS 707.79]